ncbi:MAG: 3',5'-cyclic-nucleotide phosphodiesterase [Caeruleum heppii]|nr:MAG: 3',5'-cyclic-nucleotide phosphodiesterase [Caeruleum heppii]
MDFAACNVIYVDRRAPADSIAHRGAHNPSSKALNGHASYKGRGRLTDEVGCNVEGLLSAFDQVFVCTSGSSCLSRINDLNKSIDVDLIPTLVLVDTPIEDDGALNGHVSEDSYDPAEEEEEELYGKSLLQHIVAEVQYQSFSKLFVPIATLRSDCYFTPTSNGRSPESSPRSASSDGGHYFISSELSRPDMQHILPLLDAGAVDVITSPFVKERLASLAVHGYQAHRVAVKDQKAFLAMKRGRKRSWVGVNNEEPYAYLREAMVSGLMDGICKPQSYVESFENTKTTIRPERRQCVKQAIGTWAFSAHEFSDDELLHAASLMLQHALAMPELDRWRITTESLTDFLIATRKAYNAFVPYHNFRHVVDVLQAVFYFLLQLGALPSYPDPSSPPPSPSPLASLLRPFDALCLLIAAVGHDVGHPGVNNAFLVTLNAPLAQLYNDRSVLESFHCAAFSQILRRYWPAAFQATDMRRLLITSILATDMGVHFDYMKKLGALQSTLVGQDVDSWDDRMVEEQRTLTCSLLIKCADISNVARKYHVAARWASVLTDEFARQASMEDDLGIPSALFAPPVRDSVIEMGKSQIGFMNLFALPLFRGVSAVLPAMRFSVDEMEANKDTWEAKMERATEKMRRQSGDAAVSLNNRRLSGLESSPAEHHPPGVVSDSQSLSQSPFGSPRASLQEGMDGSDLRRSSLGAFALGGDGNPSRRSSIVSPFIFGPSTDLTSRRSSGAIPQDRPRLLARRSSNTVPSQLHIGMAKASLDGSMDAPVPRTSGNPTLITKIITSTEQPPAEKPTTSPRISHHRNHQHSSEQSSNPSSHEWQFQITSPTHAVASSSPTTEATSYYGDEESRDPKDDGTEAEERPKLPPSPDPELDEPMMYERGESEGINGSSPELYRGGTPSKSVRHRSSRWRLNFWRGRRKTEGARSSP